VISAENRNIRTIIIEKKSFLKVVEGITSMEEVLRVAEE